MVNIKNARYFRLSLYFLMLLTLTGCPWGGMKYSPAETAGAWMRNNTVCFSISDSKDYQPFFMAINLRSVPPKERMFIDSPKLRVTDGELCIPSYFYHFPDNSTEPFIVEFVLRSSNKSNHARSFVSGFEMINGKVQNVPLTQREYGEPDTVR